MIQELYYVLVFSGSSGYVQNEDEDSNLEILLTKSPVKRAFLSLAAAQDYASKEVSKNPPALAHVCKTIRLIESLQPKVVHKQFNEIGELFNV